MRDHKPRSKLVLNEATNGSTRVVDEVGPSSRVDETTTSGQSHPSQSLRMPHRSGRVVLQPNRYLGLTETQVVIQDDGVEDPSSYKQAMNDVDKDQWVKAMDLKMKSITLRRIYYLSGMGFTCLRNSVLRHLKKNLYAVGIVSRYQSKPGFDNWTAVKIILKYLKRTRDYMLVYGEKDLILIGYTDSDFQTDKDFRKSTSGSVFTLNERVVVWRCIKQGCIVDSIMEVEYVAACETAKEAVWLRKFLHDLEVVPNMNLPITLYCDNSGAVANSKEPRNHKRGKHIERKYHLIREIVQRGDMIVTKIASEHNIVDPFTKTLTAKVFEGHLESIGPRDMYIR
ncbi:retrovirus-related pol polyprotein from transposon tnt 1-94 [Cucumis melo var. makuwa]|uniref:Retrovirus-related pol polyprotein from transposon tnt 1-94 n=1 Tax=Cucumis melo var. makuwa TaxID=1194695 RepID=A0A5A7TJD0_CUCMM|nr:retrovirus-related pol polyprotein from transposon tnt 1-94 [Cucumis melo var. makuwa]